MRSKAWLAASVWLRLARLPPPASRLRRSRRLRDTLAAAPGLLAYACVTETVRCYPMGPKLRHTAVPFACVIAVEIFGNVPVRVYCEAVRLRGVAGVGQASAAGL
jgi:hypothetical protein